jgi:hypothetical protein
MFRAVPLPIIRSLFFKLDTGSCHTVLKTAFEQDHDGPDYGRRNCPKHVALRVKINLSNSCIWLVLIKKERGQVCSAAHKWVGNCCVGMAVGWDNNWQFVWNDDDGYSKHNWQRKTCKN